MKVTGKPAQAKTITSDQFYARIPDDMPVGWMEPDGRRWKEVFNHWWEIYEDDIFSFPIYFYFYSL